MIWLNCQLDDLPIVPSGNLPNDFFQAIMNRTIQDVSPPFGTPDEVIHHQMYGMVFVLLLHVDKYIANSNECQYLERPLCLSPKKGTPIHPRLKAGGFLGCSL